MQFNKHGVLTGRAPRSLPFSTPPTLVASSFRDSLCLHKVRSHLFSVCHRRANDTVLCTCIVTFALAFVTFQYMYSWVTITRIHGYHYMDTRVNLTSSLLTNTIFFLSSLIGNSVTRNNAVATVGSQTRVVSMWIERGVDTFLDALKHLGGCPCSHCHAPPQLAFIIWQWGSDSI